MQQLFFDEGAIRHQGGDVAAEDIVHVAQPRGVDVENGDFGSDADRDLAGVGARDSGPKDHHLAGANSRRSAQQHPAAAAARLQAPCTSLNREPPSDFAHRREQRQAAVLELDSFVAERGDTALE